MLRHLLRGQNGRQLSNYVQRTPTQTLKMMEQSESSKNVSRALIFKWHKHFNKGRDMLKDDKGHGRKLVVDEAAHNQVQLKGQGFYSVEEKEQWQSNLKL